MTTVKYEIYPVSWSLLASCLERRSAKHHVAHDRSRQRASKSRYLPCYHMRRSAAATSYWYDMQYVRRSGRVIQPTVEINLAFFFSMGPPTKNAYSGRGRNFMVMATLSNIPAYFVPGGLFCSARLLTGFLDNQLSQVPPQMRVCVHGLVRVRGPVMLMLQYSPYFTEFKKCSRYGCGNMKCPANESWR